MNSRKNIIAMLLLPFMIIALNSFSGSGAIYAYADEKADTPAVAEQTAHDAESETTAEPGEMITEETETTSESVETTTEQVKTTSEPETESAAEADETVYAAFDESITVDGVKVRVTADAGVFPEGATLKVEKLKGVDREEAREAVDEETGDLDIAKEHLFDITILDKEGNEIQPEGKANVSFETSEVADETLETNVYHIKDNGKAEALDVDVNGVVAQVETTGFSPYSLIFSYTDSSGTTMSINLRVGEIDQIGPVLDKIGISNASQDARGGIAKAVSDAPDIVRVYEHEWAGWFLQAVAGDENEHHLTVTFKDGYEVTVKVTSHKHHWTATGDKTDALTIVCEDPQNCYYFNNVYFDDKAFTAQILAEDATYDGQPHGAEQDLQQRFPTHDVTVEKDIHYVGIEDTTYADSTTAPTNAGKYKAYYQVKPQGQDDVFTVQTTYTINKADIKFDPEPAAVSNLIYNGEDQDLYTLGAAKSATASETFPIKYWHASDSSRKVEDEVLKGKDVDTFKINYQAEGDANHNDTEVKTIEIKIGKRPVKVSGITASNKTYDGTNSATLNFDGAEFENILTGDKLTVSAKGAFADKNAGDNKTVNITDMTLGGADADKYTLDTNGQQSSTTANITAKTLKVKWQESAELQYTGEEQAPEAEFEFAENLLDGDGKAYTGDDVQPVITGKHIYPALWTATVNSLSGRDAGNYKLDTELSNVNKEYKIVPKKLTVKWTTTEKEYDAKALEPDYTLDGFVGGDQPNKHLSFTADPTELVGNQAVNAGSYKATLELTGDTAKHYEITNPKTTFTITKAPLSVYTEGWIYYGDKVESKDDINDIKYVRDKCEGFKGDDGVGVLIGDVTFTTNYKFKDNATGVDGAKYNLIAQNVEAANYDIADAGVDGELKVYPKPVELEWTHEHDGTKAAVSGEQAFTYDGKNHTYTAAVKDATDVTVETYEGNKQRDANAKTDTEKYTAKAVKLSNPNYALTDKDGKAIGTVSVDFTIAQLPVELEWTPIEFTYNGKQQAPTATATELVSGDEGKVSVTVTGGQTNARTEAYTATANGLTGDRAGNYTLPDKKTTSFTISPRSISGASVTLDKTQLTYSGSKQSVSVTEVSLDGVKLAEADYDVSGDKGTNKGDYTVKVTGKGNYKDLATADWKIVGKMTVEAEPVTAKYDGNEYGITVNVTDPSSGTTTKFGTKEGTYDLNESPKFKSAGTHTVYFKVSGNDDYDDYTGNATVTISKKAVTASVSAEDKTYDGKTAATVSASVKAEDLIRGDSVEITGLKGSFADANAGEDKKVSVDSSAAEVSGTGSDNYVVTIPEETTASVSKAAPDVTAPGAKTLTYNGKAQGLVNAGKAKGGEMQYALGENANVAPGEGWSTDIPTGTDVGDYYVWFKVIGDDNHNNTDPVCVTVRISEKKPEPVSKATITYDLNGGTLNGKTGVVTITEDIGTVITLPAPTRDGYIFDYWQGSKYYAGDKYTVNGDHTFKAVWKTGAGGNGKGGSSKGGTKTGDPNDLAGLIALMLASGGALGAMGYRRRKER